MDEFNLFRDKTSEENVQIISERMSDTHLYFRDWVLHGPKIQMILDEINNIRISESFCNCVTENYDIRVLFQSFLMWKHPVRKPTAHYLLKCHDMVNQILENPNETFGGEFLNEFIKVTPNFYWEAKVNKKFINEANSRKIKRELYDLKHECLYNLFHDDDFIHFRQMAEYKSIYLKELIIFMYVERSKNSRMIE